MLRCLFAVVLALVFTISAFPVEVTLPKGGIKVASLDELVATGQELARPMAILVYDSASTCPLHDGQVVEWMQAKQMARFVVLPCQSKDHDAKLRQTLSPGREKRGKYIPQLFFLDQDGKYLDVLAYKTDAKVVDGTLSKMAGKSPVLNPENAVEIKALLARIDEAVAKGKLDGARSDARKAVTVKAKLSGSSLVAAIDKRLDAYADALAAEVAAIVDPAARKERAASVQTLYKGLLPPEKLRAIE
jgi:hypothetical protein